MRRAIFPGSFNPYTIGHADIVQRGLELFDEIIIGIGQNMTKPSEENAARKQDIERIYADESRVKVVIYRGLTVDFAKQYEASFILRGVRSVKDYEYERDMAEANHRLSGIETVLLYSRPELAHISSSLVRELAYYGKDISEYLPK